MLTALPFVLIFARAAWRTTRSLTISHEHLTIATVGLIRPRIVIAPHFSAVVDADALAAAVEHERAHAKHRDPLRIWLAQLATELLWPAPAAVARLHCWKHALEIARDDEARAQGAAGPDLAAAIVASLRLSQSIIPPAVAATLTDETFIKERVTRLLQPPSRWKPLGAQVHSTPPHPVSRNSPRDHDRHEIRRKDHRIAPGLGVARRHPPRRHFPPRAIC